MPKPKSKRPARKRPARAKSGAPQRAVTVTRFEAPRPASRGTFAVEVDPRAIDETLGKFKDQLVHWANKGRFTKVRFRFRGKQLLPDIPLAAVVAAEGLTFYWGGILRALVMNIAGKTV